MGINCIQIIIRHPYQFVGIMIAITCCVLAILGNLNKFPSDVSAPLAYCSTIIAILIILGIVIYNCRNRNSSILSSQVIDTSAPEINKHQDRPIAVISAPEIIKHQDCPIIVARAPEIIDISKIIDNYQEETQTVTLKNSYEYANLHYKLAQMTQKAMREGTQEAWNQTLHKLNQNVHVVFPNGEKFILDCSIEFDRLNGKTIELECAELTFEDFGKNRKLFYSLVEAMRDSYGGSLESNEHYIRNHLRQYSRLFVGRNKNNPDEILGGLFIGPRVDGLFMHSVCRRAKATKIHLTENLIKFIENVYRGQKGYIYCEVDTDNLPSKNLYQKLGFVVSAKIKEGEELMRLNIDW